MTDQNAQTPKDAGKTGRKGLLIDSWPVLIPLLLIGSLLWIALSLKQRARLLESGGYVEFDAPAWGWLESLFGEQVRSIIASPTHLHLGGGRPSRSDLRMIAGFDELIDFGAAGMTDADLDHLSDCTKLETLHLQTSSLTANGIRTLQQFPNLKRLSITTDQTLPGDIFESFASAGHLQSLTIESRGMTDLQLEPLVTLPSIDQLWLGDAIIGEHDLAPLQQMPRLQFIAFMRCKIHPNALTNLPPSTVSLMLNDSSITGHHVAALQSLTSLLSLSLFGTQVPADDCRELAAALKRTQVVDQAGQVIPYLPPDSQEPAP